MEQHRLPLPSLVRPVAAAARRAKAGFLGAPLLWPRLALLAAGFVPVACVSATLLDLAPLHVLALAVVFPAVLCVVWICLLDPKLGRLALIGLVAGALATAGYDTSRLAFVALGVWEDFIPALGRRAWNDPGAGWFWGYLWRFLGNGGAMGIAFTMLPLRGAGHGATYGALVCLCLFGTLLLCPAESRLFPLTPTTATLAMVGHLEYGLILGKLVGRWAPVPGTLVIDHTGHEPCSPASPCLGLPVR